MEKRESELYSGDQEGWWKRETESELYSEGDKEGRERELDWEMTERERITEWKKTERELNTEERPSVKGRESQNYRLWQPIECVRSWNFSFEEEKRIIDWDKKREEKSIE